MNTDDPLAPLRASVVPGGAVHVPRGWVVLVAELHDEQTAAVDAALFEHEFDRALEIVHQEMPAALRARTGFSTVADLPRPVTAPQQNPGASRTTTISVWNA